MATQTKLKFIDAGFKAILTSPGTRAVVHNTAAEIAGRAGVGWEAVSRMGSYGGGRWIAYVRANTYKALLDEAVFKSLSKAVGK